VDSLNSAKTNQRDESIRHAKEVLRIEAESISQLIPKLNHHFSISENYNKIIKISSGEYIGLLGHNDELHPSALYEVIKVICKKNADFIYTDEAIFSKNIKNINKIIFKPGYAIDTLRSHNYIRQFIIMFSSLSIIDCIKLLINSRFSSKELFVNMSSYSLNI